MVIHPNVSRIARSSAAVRVESERLVYLRMAMAVVMAMAMAMVGIDDYLICSRYRTGAHQLQLRSVSWLAGGVGIYPASLGPLLEEVDISKAQALLEENSRYSM